MKNTEEMVNSLFKRCDQYRAEKRVRRKRVAKVTALSLCFIAAIGIMVLSKEIKTSTAYTDNTSKSTDAIYDSIIWGNNDAHQSEDNGFIEWNDKPLVSYRLYDALESGSEDDIFAICAKPPIGGGSSFKVDYEYQGKTLTDYYLAMCEEEHLPELLSQLLIDGEYLKYGTVLYETGLPNGEKWARSYYEETIDYYGQTLLDKYIVDGQFLKDKLERDIEKAQKQTKAADNYYKAFTAYLNHLASSIDSLLPLELEVVPQQGGIIIFLTKKGFTQLKVENMEGWAFDLAIRDNESAPTCIDD